MNFVGDYEGIVFITSVLVMLNAAIAIGVSEVLGRLKEG
ncbi:hypothetical protein KP77_33550 [Jeotgalibacillus alimentarius]|uniref:Uncharacterized protein n=1 Tax=Jeotgalibacillus alimentarius TaxID=135826 RepID=A0A0C2QXA8_9BACL|nr:hypothetical protein KP77_33550 [Jeotgalibacillus alimentarius]